MIRVRSISRSMQDMVYSMTPATAVAEAKADTLVLTKPKGLRIAKTTMPEKRLNFNDTFLHIRCELDTIYKEQNPIFDNVVVPELWVDKDNCIDNTLAAASEKTTTILEDGKTPALWISKTVVPKERLDFNDTFRHIRGELDGLYKERNPIFDNTLDSAKAPEVAEQNERQNEAISVSFKSSYGDRATASLRSESLNESWVSIPAVAER